MKKILLIGIIIIAMVTGSVVAFAEEPADIPEAVTDVVSDTEADAVVDTEADTTEIVENEIVTEKTDFEDYAEKFVDYIFSGAAGSTEIMDKIIEMGAQYLEAKEQGYTFEERISQLVTPDNIMATAAAAFLVVIGIAFFIFRRTQMASSRLTTAEIKSLKSLYEEEVKSNADLREYICKQNDVIDRLNETVSGLSEKSELTKADMNHVNKLTMATATMVKDVFMNSKTIDASGKNLLLHDYTKALEESEKLGGVTTDEDR